MNTDAGNRRTYWIVGASSGIGLEIAQLLASERHFVIASARSEEKLEALQRRYPTNVAVVPLDVSDRFSIEEAEIKLRDVTDHIDTLIACAGTCEYDDHLKFPREMYESITKVNYLGVVECVRMALPFLRESNNRPHISAIGSLSSVVPFPRAAAYGASKAAVDYFMQSLKIDLKVDGIDVTVIRPGFVDTPLTEKNDFDMPFIMASSDAAKCIVEKLDRRPMFLDFPSRLAFPLKLMRLVPSFWMRIVAPSMKKQEAI
ncbi:MAG: SDR family NAD(P)-dependent oxidoreductase [Agarilytica sp.]